MAQSRVLKSVVDDMQGTFRRRDVPVLMIGLGLILGITGPYETNDALRLVPRAAYWLAVVFITFSLGHLVSSLFKVTRPSRSGWMNVVYVSIAIAIVVTIFMLSLNRVVFGPMYEGVHEIIGFFASVVLICAVVEGCAFLLQTAPSDALDEVPATAGADLLPTEAAPILQRLPAEHQAPLLSISATDHYVSVTTEEGSCLVLMRFADAMQEAGAEGMQVHRSHWVSCRAIARLEKDGDKPYLVLTDGSQIPVSRRYLKDVQGAGWLPETQYG